MEKFKINKNLDIKKLKNDFKKNDAITIENFLDINDADRLYNFLAKEMPEDWWYASCLISKSGKPEFFRRNTIINQKVKVFTQLVFLKFTF